MNDQTGPDGKQKKPIGGELVIPVVAFFFTLYYFWTIVDVPWSAQVSAFFVGSILIVLIGLFVHRTAGSIRRGEATLGTDRRDDNLRCIRYHYGGTRQWKRVSHACC